MSDFKIVGIDIEGNLVGIAYEDRAPYEVHDGFSDSPTVCEVNLGTGRCRVMAECSSKEDADAITDALMERWENEG